VRAGAEALPFPQGMFGAALMECVFSLTDDPTAAVGELARVIQANGALLVAELYARSDESIEIPHNPVLRNIYAKGPLEAFFLQCGQCSGNSLRPSEKLPSKQCLSARPPRPAKPDEPRFALLRFVDRTPDMRSLFAQMIMDGTGDVCFDTKTRKLLRQAKVGYGIWLFARA
jgi:SAM-dependent methyltransferase